MMLCHDFQFCTLCNGRLIYMKIQNVHVYKNERKKAAKMRSLIKKVCQSPITGPSLCRIYYMFLITSSSGHVFSNGLLQEHVYPGHKYCTPAELFRFQFLSLNTVGRNRTSL